MKQQNNKVISDSASHSEYSTRFDPPMQKIPQAAIALGVSVYYLRNLYKEGSSTIR